MVIETGIDMVSIARIERSIQNPKFLEKVYGPIELEYFKRHNMPVETIAAAFSAKEAFGKAIGTGIAGFFLVDVQVAHNEIGKPYLVLSGNAKQIAEEKNLKFTLSITHTKEYTTAIVIAYTA